jgi:uncharacterized protein (DUF3084 family)
VEESKTKMIVVEIFREEAIKMNEELWDSHKKLFYALNKILKAKSDQGKLNMQVRNMQEKYQRAQESYSRVTEWKDTHQNSPETLPAYLDKRESRYLDC